MTAGTKRPTSDEDAQPALQPPTHRPLDVLLIRECLKSKSNTLCFQGQSALKIQFMRTLRVSDNDKVSNLPPGFGSFPLFRVDNYPDAFPSEKGYFLPMHQREAMWIKFDSTAAFAVKIFVGGINAVSGDPQHEDKDCKLRRLEKYKRGECIQDYVVSPHQNWLDGIADGNGTVRQFVAMPIGSGYSVEAQITGTEAKGGMQIQVTPQHLPPAAPIKFFIKTMTGKQFMFSGSVDSTIYEIMCWIEDKEGIPVDQQRLVFNGKQLEYERTVDDYMIQQDAVVHLILRLRGGGGRTLLEELAENEKMGIAAGGRIKQSIVCDKTIPGMWDGSRTTTVDIQVVNSTAFKRITGVDPPATPITAKTYAKAGYPYFDIYNEELSGIQGDFKGVKSVNQLDKESPHTDATEAAIREVEKSATYPVVQLDTNGKRLAFRHVKELEEQMEKLLRISDS
ncbi:putative integral membrane protein [Diplodia seriata]|uniref:Putative integral membrane protein n=1 Tax=Diplodia seriata TaxID=420778 RepID=A0A0G2DZP3_9PEZI|nr:putative integral membrane protein [Diplodia seriata]